MDMTYILLLLMNVADLEPDVFLSERTRGVVDDVFEALGKSAKRPNQSCYLITYLQALAVLLLLLVNYTQAEIDFVGLFEIRSHAHDLGEGLLGVIEGAVAVVKNTDAIPQLGLLHIRSHVSVTDVRCAKNKRITHLGITEVIQGLLVGGIRFLQVVHHQMTMT